MPPNTTEKKLKSKEKYQLTNWPQYNKALVNRGFATLWLTEKTLAQWYYKGPRKRGGVFRFSDSCIQAVLAIKAVFRLAFRQTQGLIKSFLSMMKVDMQVPSYSQICRRQIHLQTFKAPGNPVKNQAEPIHLVVDSTGLKVYGEGEWKVRKHGADKRRIWRKLHLVADEATNIIHAVELTSHSTSDAEMVKPLLDATEWRISKLSGDGAYDQVKVYYDLETRQIQPLIPPRSNAVIWNDENGHSLLHPRNESITKIRMMGIREWKSQIGYHRRSKAETAMFRWKAIFGERLWARLLTNQKAEAQIKTFCLNQFVKLGMPKAIKLVPK